MCNGKREKFFEEGKHVLEHTHNITILNHLENQIQRRLNVLMEDEDGAIVFARMD